MVKDNRVAMTTVLVPSSTTGPPSFSCPSTSLVFTASCFDSHTFAHLSLPVQPAAVEQLEAEVLRSVSSTAVVKKRRRVLPFSCFIVYLRKQMLEFCLMFFLSQTSQSQS